MSDKLKKLDSFGQSALGPLILRLVLAVVFVYHGLQKINAETAYGSAWIIPQPGAWDFFIQVAVSWGEVLLGGVLLTLGLLTRLTAAGGAIVQLAAIYVQMHITEFGSAKVVGWDFNLCLVGMCLALVFLGGGTLSMDRCLRAWRQAKKGANVARPEAAPAAPVS
jgi:uncharacterized membrane protein YphA (DoxX/SURF4 family)